MSADCALLSIEDHRMVGTDGGWQETSIVMFADLFVISSLSSVFIRKIRSLFFSRSRARLWSS